ncbi:pseudouridine synthase [Trichoderma citrinoviride]|uniref:Pseudouridine synthase n=1 Tax=Trichoderma citrinoviride TaxID=58853 RepID=A0A2T4AYQ2_9HYPO|nr:pseudouridine synthase [Trichoderma citrinoviride]PTB62091.1 pseudouridine synthase [Trichoderma citrinoviride]
MTTSSIAPATTAAVPASSSAASNGDSTRDLTATAQPEQPGTSAAAAGAVAEGQAVVEGSIENGDRETHVPKKPAPRDRSVIPDHNAALITPAGDIWPRPYVFEDDLRRVLPYHFTYNTYCKERWRGRSLIDIFESEFRDRPVEYYRNSMVRGDIFVNGRVVGPDYIVRNGDLISHTLHRHEPPVTAEPIGIIHEDDDIIVINKPSGVPVHPAGRYNFNSVIEIMIAERGRGFMPYPCNRLDRLTSGIMFIAKSVKAAEAMAIKIRGRTVRKEYLARVVGHFPDGEVVCDQPILQISPKLGLNRVRANGKSARTVFKRLAYYPPPDGDADEPAVLAEDGRPPTPSNEEERGADEQRTPWLKKKGYSIVRCLPVTGRTHQLRVHLQYLGHPIQNDPIYANQRVWGLNLGQADADGSHNTDEDIISRLNRMGKEDVAEAVVYYDEMVDRYEKKRAEKMTGELCDICETPLYSDPGSHELSLWLHSLRYEDADGSWAYTSPLPKWALPPEGMSGPTTVGGMEELVEAVRDENPEISSEVQAKAKAAAGAKEQAQTEAEVQDAHSGSQLEPPLNRI